MKICILGLGYIGLPTACLFANANQEVIGVDINQATIEKSNHNELPFEENGWVEARTISRRDVFGVAYKGGVDDTRETPALKFIKLAENEGYKVKVHDPHVKEFEYEEDAGYQTMERSRI